MEGDEECLVDRDYVPLNFVEDDEPRYDKLRLCSLQVRGGRRGAIEYVGLRFRKVHGGRRAALR